MRIFKIVVFSLLAINIVMMALHKDPHEAIDQLGWVILLAAFFYETSHLDKAYVSKFEQYGLYAALCIGYALAIFASYKYYEARDWIDFANSVTWLTICALMIYDVYSPGDYNGVEWRVRNGVKIALYGLLIVFVLLWAWEGVSEPRGLVGFLDAYDAALWIACFFVVKLNVFKFETKNTPELARPAG